MIVLKVKEKLLDLENNKEYVIIVLKILKMLLQMHLEENVLLILILFFNSTNI